MIHEQLTRVLLCGQTKNTSKGKSMDPARKLEKNLKKVIRDFRLVLDVYQSSHSSGTALGGLKFEEWFRLTIVEVFTEKMPSTVEYLCRALDVQDSYASLVFQQMRTKTLILSSNAHQNASDGFMSSTKSTNSAIA